MPFAAKPPPFAGSEPPSAMWLEELALTRWEGVRLAGLSFVRSPFNFVAVSVRSLCICAFVPAAIGGSLLAVGKIPFDQAIPAEADIGCGTETGATAWASKF